MNDHPDTTERDAEEETRKLEPITWAFTFKDNHSDGYLVEIASSEAKVGSVYFAEPENAKSLVKLLERSRSGTRRPPLQDGTQRDAEPAQDQPQAGGPPGLERLKAEGNALLQQLLKSGDREEPLNGIFGYDIRRSKGRGQHLIVTIDLSDAPGLQDFPFEILYSDSEQNFLATGETFGLRRKFSEGHEVKPPKDVTDPLQMLVVVSNPHTKEELKFHTQSELDGLLEAVQSINERGERSIALTVLKTGAEKPEERPYLDNFCDRLGSAQPPHIIHFIGHGSFKDGVGYLEFERIPSQDDPDPVHQVSAEVLGDELPENRPWLIVLNSCEGGIANEDSKFGGIAQTLVTCGVPYVVAMGSTITDSAAISFSKFFYPSLLEHNQVSRAMAVARRKIKTRTTKAPELHTPILFTSIDADEIGYVAAGSKDEAKSPAIAGDNDNSGDTGNSRKISSVALGTFLVMALGAVANFATIQQWPAQPGGDRPVDDPVLADLGGPPTTGSPDQANSGDRDREFTGMGSGGYYESDDPYFEPTGYSLSSEYFPIYPEDQRYLEEIIRETRAELLELDAYLGASRLPENPTAQELEDFSKVEDARITSQDFNFRMDDLLLQIERARTGADVDDAIFAAEQLRGEVLDTFEDAAIFTGLYRERQPMGIGGPFCEVQLLWGSLEARPPNQSAALVSYAGFRRAWARCQSVSAVRAIGTAHERYPPLESVVRSRTSARVIEKGIDNWGRGELVSARAIGARLDEYGPFDQWPEPWRGTFAIIRTPSDPDWSADPDEGRIDRPSTDDWLEALEADPLIELEYGLIAAPDTDLAAIADVLPMLADGLETDDERRSRISTADSLTESTLEAGEFYLEGRFTLRGPNDFGIDPGNPELSEDQRERLDEYAQFLIERPDYALLLEGLSARGEEETDKLLNGLVAASRVQVAIEQSPLPDEAYRLEPGRVATISCGATRPDLLLADGIRDRVRISILPPGFADPGAICGWLGESEWGRREIEKAIAPPPVDDEADTSGTAVHVEEQPEG